MSDGSVTDVVDQSLKLLAIEVGGRNPAATTICKYIIAEMNEIDAFLVFTNLKAKKFTGEALWDWFKGSGGEVDRFIALLYKEMTGMYTLPVIENEDSSCD